MSITEEIQVVACGSMVMKTSKIPTFRSNADARPFCRATGYSAKTGRGTTGLVMVAAGEGGTMLYDSTSSVRAKCLRRGILQLRGVDGVLPNSVVQSQWLLASHTSRDTALVLLTTLPRVEMFPHMICRRSNSDGYLR